jgi:hypothetical protein
MEVMVVLEAVAEEILLLVLAVQQVHQVKVVLVELELILFLELEAVEELEHLEQQPHLTVLEELVE